MQIGELSSLTGLSRVTLCCYDKRVLPRDLRALPLSVASCPRRDGVAA